MVLVQVATLLMMVFQNLDCRRGLGVCSFQEEFGTMRTYPWQKKRRRVLKWLAIVLSPFIAATAFRLYVVHANNRLLAEFHAQGLPVTLEQLDAWYPAVRAEDNAGLELLGVLKTLKELPREQDQYLPVIGTSKGANLWEEGVALLPESEAAMRAYLTENAEPISRLHAALEKTACRYPVDFKLGMRANLEHLAQVRQVGRNFLLESLQSSLTGDTALTTRDICDMLRTAATLREEPMLIDQLVRVAIVGMSHAGLAHAASHVSLAEPDLTVLQGVLREARSPQAFKRALAGEMCGMTAALQDYGTIAEAFGQDHNDSVLKELGAQFGVGPAFLPQVLALGAIGIGLRDVNVGYLVRAYHLALRQAEEPFPQRIDAMHAVERQVQAYPALSGIAAQNTLPSLLRAVDAFAREEAYFRIMETAVAIERFRGQNGALPKQLEELVPAFVEAVPQDPFDGKPLRYRLEERGYTLYSVERDREDDGGLRHTAVLPQNDGGRGHVKNRGNFDLSFTVQR